MKKAFWVVVMLYTFLPIYGQEKATESQAKDSQSTHETDSTLSKFTPKTPITVTVVNQQATKDEQQRAKNEPKSYFNTLVGPNNLPNLLLVLVGIGGIVAAVFTLIAIRRQTDIMAAPLQQWLELTGWKNEITTLHEMPAIKISFAVENKTNYPITLLSGSIQFANPNWGDARYEIAEDSFFPPKGLHTIEAALNIGDDKTHRYQTGGVGIGVRGELFFRGVLRRKEHQRFMGIVYCSRTQTNFENEVSMKPVPAKDSEPQPQNLN